MPCECLSFSWLTADLAELFSVTSADVYGFFSVRADSPDLADEILAQTYEAAARELASNPGTAIGIGWLITVERRRLIDPVRDHTLTSDDGTQLIRLDLIDVTEI